jgi:hypothetical protein
MARRKKVSPAEGSRAATGDSNGESVARRLEGLDAASPARDEARLLAQSPWKLFFYWSFARDPRETLRRALGGAGEGFGLAARLVDLESGAVEALVLATRDQSAWFEARPHRAYRAEVGFFAEGSPFVRVLSSNVVETAPDAPSQVSDEEPDFRVNSQRFALILAASGFVERASDFAHASTARVASDDGPPNSSTLARRAPSSFALFAGSSDEVPEHMPHTRQPGASENF